ncbi:MAG TPA: low affinity iron permease family protein [Chitinophagaceae bacterium]|nr:low affinity iron permease family protein [Chitinophagaceae bacterium]
MKKTKKKTGFYERFEKISSRITKACGNPFAVLAALLIIIAWGLSGPMFNFSETWQLVINTGTTIITFIMVFIIQHSQNKDTTAIQLKLNELLASNSHASNRLVNIEDLTEEELQTLKKFYVKLSQLAAQETDVFSSHSIDEAKNKHLDKQKK